MKAVARHAPTVARVLLGLVFFVFGLNGFFNFIPQPSSIPEGAAAFAGAMMKAGYFFPLLKATEVLSGALLLAGRFVPLALAMLAPVVINILAFHLALEPAGDGMAIAILLLEGYLAWSYRDAFRPMLDARARPAVGPAAASASGKAPIAGAALGDA